LEELCKILKKNGAKIFIGENSSYNTELCLKVCGVKYLSKYAKILNFEHEKKKIFMLDKETRTLIPEIMSDVDLVINVSKMKTHGLTGVTLCVKNLYGCIPEKMRMNYHKVFLYSKDFSRMLFKLHEKIKPGLNIIDGVEGIEGNGPGLTGKKIKSGMLIASRSAFAADVVASDKMGFDYKKIYTNVFSGVRMEDIDVLGDGKEIKLNFEKPFASFLSIFIPFFKSSKPSIKFNHELCKRCHLCENKCPMKAIKLSPFPESDRNKCINCLCCIEVCPNKAIYLQDSFIMMIVNKILHKIR